jgi:hypothetical protein
MSKAVKARAVELFEKIKDLSGEDAIAPIIKAEREYWDGKVTIGTIGSYFSTYSALFKDVELKEGVNAGFVKKQDGKIELKHYFHKHFMSEEDWKARNTTDRVTQRLDKSTLIDPLPYVQSAERLLYSTDPHEIAVGLIALTGRRPTEMMLTAQFKRVKGESHKLRFSGQLKKRDNVWALDTHVKSYVIDTLLPANLVLSKFNELRATERCQALAGLTPDEVHSRCGRSLDRVAKKHFTRDIVPARADEADKEVSCKSLRAVYVALAARRELPIASVGEQIKYMSLLIGHYEESDNSNDASLKHIQTTLGYSDYYPSVEVLKYEPTPREKTTVTRIYDSDKAFLDEKAKEWGMSAPDVLKRLIALATEPHTLKDEDEMNRQEVETVIQDVVATKLEEKFQKLEDMLHSALAGVPVNTQTVEQVKAVQPVSEVKATKSGFDWESVSSEDLRGHYAHHPGSAEEKIKRSIRALMAYNDLTAPSNNERWAIKLRTVLELSGCNYKAVKTYMDSHKVMIDDHNAKYGLGDYHNKCHSDKNIAEVVKW